MNRRTFIQKFAVICAALLVPRYLISGPWFRRKRKVRILHTNDFHSRIEPFDTNHSAYPNQGGISRIMTLINKRKDKNTLLLDCGDIMQGTPYFNEFGGSVEIKWMNKAGYDVATIGNHDFDNGLNSLAFWIKQANFDFVNCNYETKGTVLDGLLKPYVIKTINRRKIGIIGVGIDPKGLVPDKNCKGIVYTDPIEKVNLFAKKLKKEENADMVVVLSHLGFSYPSNKIDDCKLAANSKNVDLILGGHTHTFMDKPHVVKNLKNKQVVIHQVGWAGLKLGDLEFKV